MKIVGMSLVLAGALFASDYSYEVSPMLGGVTPEGNLNIDEQFTCGLRFQMNDYDLLGLTPELSFDRTKDTDYETQVGDTAINRFGFNGLYEIKDVSDTLTPYLLIGLGYEDVEDEPREAYDSSLYGNYGAGVKWKLFEEMALRAEVKHLIRTDDGGNELYYGIGLSIPFGEKASEPVVEEEAPAVVEEVTETIIAPSDSDHDGVVDEKDTCPTTPVGRAVDAKGCELDGDNDGVVDALDKCPRTIAGVSVDVNGCAESVILAIKFENASSKIDEKHSPQLQEYVEFMKRNSVYDVTIIGHTDSRGSSAFNQRLSQDRAEAVKANLVNAGIEASRITTIGKGEDEPIADNTTAEGRAENRRIEAKLRLK